MEEVIIIGASGHGKVIADIIIKPGDSIIGFLDDNTELGDMFIGYPILGTIDDYKKYVNYKFVIAIGNNAIREKIAQQLDVNWYTAIHPSAIISSLGVKVGAGTVIMANAVVNSCALVGKHCIINTGAIVEHDNVIGDYVHVAVGAKLAGNVVVEKCSWIGIGAQIIQGKRVKSNAIIGAGAVVVSDVESNTLVMGVPAKAKNEK